MKKEIRLDNFDLLTRKHMINQMYPKVKPKMGKEGVFYVQAVEDLERFFEDMENGKTIDPIVIEKDIQALEKHLKAWQDFAKGQSAFPDDLKAMEEIIDNINREFKHAQQKNNMSDKEINQIKEEETYHTIALKALEHFFDDMENGKTIDPIVIEKDIQALEKHLKEWQDFAKGQSTFPDDLKAMKEIIDNINREFKHAQQIDNMSNKEISQIKKEETYYKIAVEALNVFTKDMEKFDLTNPSKIQKDIATLEKHLANWKGIVDSGNSFYPEDLEAMEKIVQCVKEDWVEVQLKLKSDTLS